MKYKIGDKVIIIRDNRDWSPDVQEAADNLPGSIATIKEVKSSYYTLEEIRWHWFHHDIEGLAPAKKLLDLTTTRFELMDFE